MEWFNFMKYAVRYASRGGNTKAVAEVIADKVGVKALHAYEPITEEVDVLFVGGGVLFNSPTKELKEFLASLDGTKVKEIVAFSTAEFSGATIKKIEAAAKEKGLRLTANLYF
ncbi:flavodoxin family protein [Lactococcus protaetiae]|uniref:flavodoxin family protein n=1 Tax=Lactococcus protaetiae TaxID=2592653 RepID=UPI001CC1D64E|nr:flavodoxin family protein [Lactococcus protaetiae]